MKRASLISICSFGAVVAACQTTDQLPGHDAGPWTATDGGPSSLDGGADGGATIYSGVVLAKTTQGADGGTCSAYADFVAGPLPALDPCAADGISEGSCCCSFGITTSLPVRPPDIGTITVSPIDLLDAPTPLVTLTPFAADRAGPGYLFQWTWDLGLAWYQIPGGYPQTSSRPWSPGSSLAVDAPGHDLPAISVVLRTGAPLAGVTPSLDAAVAIDRSQDLQLTWTPDQTPDELVLLALRQISSNGVLGCFCAAPDSAGSLTVPAGVLGQYDTDQNSCTFELERLTTSTVQNGKAKVDLVGATALETTATFQ